MFITIFLAFQFIPQCSGTAKDQIRLRKCTVWSGVSLFAHICNLCHTKSFSHVRFTRYLDVSDCVRGHPRHRVTWFRHLLFLLTTDNAHPGYWTYGQRLGSNGSKVLAKLKDARNATLFDSWSLYRVLLGQRSKWTLLISMGHLVTLVSEMVISSDNIVTEMDT